MYKLLTLISSVILIIGLLIFYVFQINTEISVRFSIKEYQKRITELSNQNKILAINSTQNGSLEKMAEIIASQDFEKIDKIHYIRVLNTQVVAK
ncbi:MAG: hypothetical protein COU42_01280 [Candidatus Nealsonbacteria bacterium CG10_big_fil_rev_8_21_14_0_10_36_24]|uniref:Uncharacterized protein n=2 Tax=Candidatus Nealsoniibacteriota TaxID=1817911 RepID=A0A2H0YNN9_9BACT|nr:MAG: hypothetical protein COU42_01280 [Candidatus Nealsonbacteria bacterium CG10_big_fil_rev_8_21_14_0_10_36_24]PIS40114.1 MAG: hypothetical protein COT32_01500 [Candidatus Nealsonbacteria bacterium CG08_land_8_20_14_0_20_36_22]